MPFPYGVLLSKYVGLGSPESQRGVPWFMLMASSPRLLCSTSYITNCVVITDVTFLMAQLLQPKRLE